MKYTEPFMPLFEIVHRTAQHKCTCSYWNQGMIIVYCQVSYAIVSNTWVDVNELAKHNQQPSSDPPSMSNASPSE
jgi:hypothetical protein